MPMFQDEPEDLPSASESGDVLSQPIAIQTQMQTQTPQSPPFSRRLSEESIRTALCDGPVPDSPPPPRSPELDAAMATSDRAELIERLKRGESPTWIPNRHLESLLHRRGPLSPTRSPRSPLLPSTPSPTLLPAAPITSGGQADGAVDQAASEGAEGRLSEGLGIERPRSALHSGDFTQDQEAKQPAFHRHEDLDLGLGRNRDSGRSGEHGISNGNGTCRSWLATSPPRPANAIDIAQRTPRPAQPDAFGPTPGFGPAAPGGLGGFDAFGGYRSELSSMSSSLSSSFVYKHPTSPLVQSESNDDDVEFTMPADSNLDVPPGAARNQPRRHTLTAAVNSAPYMSTSRNTLWSQDMPVASPQTQQSSAQAALQQPPASVFGHRRGEGLQAYQAHQPRRSLTSTPSISLAAQSTPTSPAFMRSRRPSFSSDLSPLQHASMVGSYEESILRGRMSTTPSKPLDFLAQIGVLGLGKCKPSLRCPSHVTLPFSAVFYSYPSTSYGRSGGKAVEDGPSPYVGMVDLENGLPNPEDDARARRKMQSRSSAAAARVVAATRENAGDVSMSMVGNGGAEEEDDDMSLETSQSAQATETTSAEAERVGRRIVRPKKRSSSPKAPPGGSYRIPAKGQLQIVIKNQNKTAVKLFLVPYDLSGMEPGTKTFIRQRIFSAGLAMEGENPAAGLNGAPADDKDQPRGNASQDGEAHPRQQQPQGAAARPILRYLIHLHICCPAKGRYYLYKSIRVVFANRVPDDKERLRNELTYPEPRFSAYKPVRVMHPPMASMGNGVPGPGAGTLLAADRAFRRRSSGFAFSSPHAQQVFDDATLLHGGVSLSRSHSHSHSLLAQVVATGYQQQQQQQQSSSPSAAYPSPFAMLGMNDSSSSPSLSRPTGSDSGNGNGGNLPDEPSPFWMPQARARVERVMSDSSDATASMVAPAATHSGDAWSTASKPAISGEGVPRSAAVERGGTLDGAFGGLASTMTTSAASPAATTTQYSKLSKGDVGYGGNAFLPPAEPGAPGSPRAAEGLLSKRLRSLGVQSGDPGSGKDPSGAANEGTR